jgi:uncharacterized membrane protein
LADLFVLGFGSKEKAEAVLELTKDLQKQELLDLEDAALVWRTDDGKININDKFLNDVAAALQPGTAAVFALVRRSTPDKVQQALLPYEPTIVRTSLSTGEESELVRRLQEAQAQVQAGTQHTAPA